MRRVAGLLCGRGGRPAAEVGLREIDLRSTEGVEWVVEWSDPMELGKV
jgi:hypothetical protein